MRVCFFAIGGHFISNEIKLSHEKSNKSYKYRTGYCASRPRLRSSFARRHCPQAECKPGHGHACHRESSPQRNSALGEKKRTRVFEHTRSHRCPVNPPFV